MVCESTGHGIARSCRILHIYHISTSRHALLSTQVLWRFVTTEFTHYKILTVSKTLCCQIGTCNAPANSATQCSAAADANCER